MSSAPPFETPPTSPNGTVLDRSSTTVQKSVNLASRPVSSASSFALTTSVYSTPSIALPLSFSVLPPPPATSDRPVHANPTSPTTPLSPTTRPLNVSKSFSPLFNLKANLVVPNSEPGDRSATPKNKSQRRKSGSPAIGPSPLRNAIEPSLSDLKSSEHLLIVEQTYDSPSGALGEASWELTDLMKNGRLDVDAVSEALGLGFG